MRGYITEIWGWNDDWQVSDFAKHFCPERITVAYKGNQLAGYSHAEIQNGELFLRMMVVDPAHQRKGVGAKLLASFISSGKEQARNVSLEVFKINPEAKIFYEKHGFIAEEEKPNSFVMRLNA